MTAALVLVLVATAWGLGYGLVFAAVRPNVPADLLAAVPIDPTEVQARALRGQVHEDLQLPPAEADDTEDLRPRA